MRGERRWLGALLQSFIGTVRESTFCFVIFCALLFNDFGVWTLMIYVYIFDPAITWTLLFAFFTELGYHTGILNCLSIWVKFYCVEMENLHNCAMCRRGFYRGRYQQHVLTDNLPRAQPELAAYIQENAVLEVSISISIIIY